MFTSKDEIRLGAKYKDVVTGCEGICVNKTEHLTGCDTATIETAGREAAFLKVDVTRLEKENIFKIVLWGVSFLLGTDSPIYAPVVQSG